MTIPLTGVAAAILFIALGAMAVLLFFMALVIRYAAGLKFWGLKLFMMALTFLSAGLGGGLLLYLAKSNAQKRSYDQWCWLELVLAVIISVMIALKKEDPVKT